MFTKALKHRRNVLHASTPRRTTSYLQRTSNLLNLYRNKYRKTPPPAIPQEAVNFNYYLSGTSMKASTAQLKQSSPSDLYLHNKVHDNEHYNEENDRHYDVEYSERFHVKRFDFGIDYYTRSKNSHRSDYCSNDGWNEIHLDTSVYHLE